MKDVIIDKYNIPGPRYTSYPTVPFWDASNYNLKNWTKTVLQGFWTHGREVSIYVHLPFCESLCTYCACNKRITKDHSVEDRYIEAVLKEWQLYLDLLPEKPVIKDIHLGGGTPTFFQPANLGRLLDGLGQEYMNKDDHSFSFEAHPNNTTKEHLQVLFDHGFTRLSLGIQDFDLQVQKNINRIQPFHKVESVVKEARAIGFESINFDLVYGLPGQTIQSFTETINKTVNLMPDRIALYGYAHVPKMHKAQKSFEHLLPTSKDRAFFYRLGKKLLGMADYYDIGMDHFALESDTLFKAFTEGKLNRSFMGYTEQESTMLIGLGISAISDAWLGYSQNDKNLESYYNSIETGNLPLSRGHILNEPDLIIRKHITNLMCKFSTKWSQQEFETFGLDVDFDLLDSLMEDGLIHLSEDGILITEEGKPFVRNVCMAFDARMNHKKSGGNSFSQIV